MAGDRGSKPAADPAQDGLFREIEEDLRHDRYVELWKKYGDYLIGAAVALVLAVAGYEGWKAWDAGVRNEVSERFSTAVGRVAADPSAAEATFRELAADAPGGYAFLAGLREAEAILRQGDPLGAAALYERLESETQDPLYADLARLLSVLAKMAAGGAETDADGLRAALTPLAASDRPLRYSARELLAYLDLRTGDAAAARQRFADLAEDPEAPTGLRLRARSMATHALDG